MGSPPRSISPKLNPKLRDREVVGPLVVSKPLREKATRLVVAADGTPSHLDDVHVVSGKVWLAEQCKKFLEQLLLGTSEVCRSRAFSPVVGFGGYFRFDEPFVQL